MKLNELISEIRRIKNESNKKYDLKELTFVEPLELTEEGRMLIAKNIKKYLPGKPL